MTGEIDAVASGVLDAEQLEPLLQMPSSAFSVRVDQGMSWEHIDLNFDNPIINPPANPGAGKKLRQALIYAVDRDAVNLAVYGGRNTVVNGWLPQRHYGFAKATRNYVYDPSLAEKLLTEAGWSLKAGEDIRTDATGRKLELELVTTAGNPQRENVQAILQKYWRALGINVIIKTDPTRHFFSETLGKREFKALALYAFTFSPTVTGENLWTSTNIPSEVNQWHGQNFPGYRNQEIDHLLSVIPVTLDKPRRVELFRRQQELWIDELPALPLFFGTNVTVYPTGCKNWRPTGTAQPETWNVEHWTCPSLADLRPDNGVKE